MIEVIIYTDGACSGNPGPGGWGALIKDVKSGHVVSSKEIYGGAKQTTNNRTELTAAINSLQILKRRSTVTLVTDSVYLRDGMTQWLKSWIANKWKTSSKKEIKNKDLWENIHTLSQEHDIKWEWVKGHNAHPENERADYLARLGMKKYKKPF